MAPRYLGVRAKIAKSFARIHKANLCNFGILPLTFKDPEDYDRLENESKVIFPDIKKHLENDEMEMPVLVNGNPITALLDVSDRQRELLIAGGVLNLVKKELKDVQKL